MAFGSKSTGRGARSPHGVDVEGSGISTERAPEGWGREEAARRFGGLDVPATIAGALAALGSLVVLGGTAGALGNIGYQVADGATDDTSVAVGGLVAGFIVLVASFLMGGWVAGRVARYDGGRNGLVAAVWFLLLGAVFAGLGAWAGERWDVFAEVDLPQWFTTDDATTAGIISAVVGVLLVLLAAFLGGKLGERYHRRADATVAGARRDGALRHTDHDRVDVRDDAGIDRPAEDEHLGADR